MVKKLSRKPWPTDSIGLPKWRIIVPGIETKHMIRKGQLDCPKEPSMSAAQWFYILAV